MILVLHRLSRQAAILMLLAVLAVVLVPAAVADDWASERAATAALVPAAVADDWGRERAATAALDPAIRAAIGARSSDLPPASAAMSAVASAPGQGFAWGDALIGAAVGIAGVCTALVCVNLVRHDGRLRSA